MKFQHFQYFLAKLLHTPQIEESIANEVTPSLVINEIQNDFHSKDANFYDYVSLQNPLTNCEYNKPKTSYGTHPGFQIKCDKDIYKVKFGNEIFSGPFNSRIYKALGYIAPEINYVNRLTMAYDRRYLTEFNSRREFYLRFKLAGMTVRKVDAQAVYDPFAYVLLFKLNDGSLMTPQNAKLKLLKNPNVVNVTDDNINDAFNSQIKELIFRPSTLTTKNDGVVDEEVGPWSSLDLDYRNFKEVRALVVASAWVGNYDLRKDNLRIFLTSKESGQQVKMGFNDIGSGLGRARFAALNT